MKKLFTLLFSVGAFVTSFAQQQGRPNDYHNQQKTTVYDRGYDNRRLSDTYVFTARERDFEIQKINREFDMKINSIKSRWLMNRRQKIELIQNAERERSHQVQIVYAKFNDRRNRFDNGYSSNSGYDKRDNSGYDKHDNNNWKH